MVEPPNTSKVAMPPDIGPAYRLAAGGRQEAEDDRLSLLERILDPLFRRRRDLVRPGWRCLEVGVGRGSMVVWLAEQAGESDKVVAADIDVAYFEADPSSESRGAPAQYMRSAWARLIWSARV